jgi:acyl-CoA thioesterase
MSRFDADTAVVRVGPDLFEGAMSRDWWVVRGPNGGYVAAVLLRALQQRLADPERHVRSLTVHYTAAPAEGPVRIHTTIERAGRSLSTLSGRMIQGDRLLALALAAFSKPWKDVEFHHASMPEAAPPEQTPPGRGPRSGPSIPLHERYDTRWALGSPPFSGAPEALAGGWIRLAEPRVADAVVVAALADAWTPSVFSWATPGVQIAAVPTIDLTVHFRASLPLKGAKADDYYLAVFRAREAREGFFEEDGEIWSRDGILMAQSRQLAILM